MPNLVQAQIIPNQEPQSSKNYHVKMPMIFIQSPRKLRKEHAILPIIGSPMILRRFLRKQQLSLHMNNALITTTGWEQFECQVAFKMQINQRGYSESIFMKVWRLVNYKRCHSSYDTYPNKSSTKKHKNECKNKVIYNLIKERSIFFHFCS